MNLASFFNSFANKVESFFVDDLDENKRSVKKIAKLEKSIYSQEKRNSKKYGVFLETIDPSAFEIGDFAIKESLKNRISKNNDFNTLKKNLSDQEIDFLIAFNRLDRIELRPVDLKDFYEPEHSELVSFLFACVQEIRNHLQGKRIVKLLTSFISKKHHSLNLLYLQIPLRHSFLAFFDQLFTLKDVEQNSSFEYNILFYVNIKKSNNETRRINRFVPAFSGT